ncbi:MAG: type II toxin-antitoxin system PrlF family antitoxin [Nitrospirae bacterium]|nr:type II toxin-antitoxin system PrlF family antitoxin [Nitrospirota bacterium]
MRSMITSKYQTTIPKKIRETLKLSVHDAVEWRINGHTAIVCPTQRAFLVRRGAVKIGKGDIAADIKKARLIRSGRKR